MSLQVGASKLVWPLQSDTGRREPRGELPDMDERVGGEVQILRRAPKASEKDVDIDINVGRILDIWILGF